MYTSNIKYIFSLRNQTKSSNCAVRQYFPNICIPLPFTSQHISLHKWTYLQAVCKVGENRRLYRYNTQCCPKIGLCGWQKASNCTLVQFLSGKWGWECGVVKRSEMHQLPLMVCCLKLHDR